MDFLSPFCSVCLKNTNKLKSIDCLDTDNFCIQDKLNFCVFMQESTYMQKPLNICQTCHKNLNIAFYFREMALKSNDLLNEYITYNSKILNLDQDDNQSIKELNEIICEIVDDSDVETVILQTTDSINESFQEVEKQLEKMFQDDESIKSGLIDISDDEFVADSNIINNLRCEICNVYFENETSSAWHLQVHETLLIFQESQKNTSNNINNKSNFGYANF